MVVAVEPLLATDGQHFRTGAADGGLAEVYDTDHAASIGWRYAPPAVPAR